MPTKRQIEQNQLISDWWEKHPELIESFAEERAKDLQERRMGKWKEVLKKKEKIEKKLRKIEQGKKQQHTEEEEKWFAKGEKRAKYFRKLKNANNHRNRSKSS
jgi:hypothetical protein